VKETLASPFRVFGIAARSLPLPARIVLFWNQALVQSVAPAEVSPLLVLRSHFAVSTCPGCVVFLLRAAADDCLGYRLRPLVEVALPLEFHPAIPTRPPQRSGPLMGFASLQHLRNPRSTSRGPSLPATFRLQGLATLLTAYALESRAGFVSHRQRSWDSPFGGVLSRKVSRPFGREKPTYRWPSGISAAEASDRPEGTRFLGSRLLGLPCGPAVF